MRKISQKTITLLAVLLMLADVFGCSKRRNISSSPDQVTLGSLSGFSSLSAPLSSPAASSAASPAASSAASPAASSAASPAASPAVSSALSAVVSSAISSSASASSSLNSKTKSSKTSEAEKENDEVPLAEFIEKFIEIADKQPQYPVQNGKTVYGKLFGNPYADWCTEFVMYCLKQTEDKLGTDFIGTVYPWRDNAYDTGLWFKRQNRYYDAHGSFIPSRGDLIIFDSVHAGYPNHIGIVTGTVAENGITYITTIEGNIPEDKVSQVRCRKLATTNPIIMGYCSTTQVTPYSGPLSRY